MTTILGYWNCQGKAQPIRYLLEYTGMKYENKIHNDHELWFKTEKAAYKGDFPNLPYLIDGEKHLTESSAIPIYICFKAKRSDLLGRSEDEIVQTEVIKGIRNDCQAVWMKYAFGGSLDNESWKKMWDEQVFPKFEQLDKYVGTEKPFFFADYPQYIDFYVVTQLSAIYDVLPEAKKFKNLLRIHDNVKNVQQIKDFITSDRYIKDFLPHLLWNNLKVLKY